MTERWSVLGNWCYVDSLVTDPDPRLNDQPARVCPIIPSTSGTGTISSKMNGRGVALGTVYVGDRLGDDIAPPQPQFILPSYTRSDAGLYYHRDRFDTSVYFENIFNTRYYASSISQFQIQPGDSFNVQGEIEYRF